MALIGRFHPLIVHFSIALVMVASWAEGVAIATLTAAAAVVTFRSEHHLRLYRTALFFAATLVAVAGHVGGLLVWGADFQRP